MFCLVNKIFTLLFFLNLQIFAYAENKDVILTILDNSVHRLYENPDDCIAYTQGFLIDEHLPENRILLQNIIAQAYAMKGDYVQSIRMSLDNERLESDKDRPSQFSQFFLDYALAEQYQNLGLFNQSEKLIQRIIQQNHRESKGILEKITLAKTYQLHGINLGVFKKYNEAINIFNFTNNELLSYSKESDILKFENIVFTSGNYIYLKDYSKAKVILNDLIKALHQYPKAVFLEALVKERLSRIYFLEGDFQLSLELLEEAYEAIEHVDYPYLKSKIFQGFSKNYLAIKDLNNYKIYQAKFDEVDSKLSKNSKEGIRYLLKLTETNELKNFQIIENKYIVYKYIVSVFFAFSIFVLVVIFALNRLRRKELSKQLDFFSKQSDLPKDPILDSVPAKLNLDLKKQKKQITISKETEKDLLLKLKEFESSKRYLNKEMSLATLAGQFDTNTKYLSEVINKYKGKNFSSYINELRINYIACLLRTDSNFLNYKVSYLAEISGFTSHSTFTTVFKSVTGVSPNIYIQQITNKQVV